MNFDSPFWHTPVRIVAFGLLAFVLLAARFSPNWVAFYSGLRAAKVNVSSSAQSSAIEKAILSGYSERGLYVTKQARDLSSEIEDPNHKIVRWRLLVPVLGRFLRLPSWLILSLAQVGCFALILAFVAIGSAQCSVAGRPSYEAICLGVVAGASAPFFTSMGLLGYYDSWLTLALLGVAFVRQRWVVAIACLLAPWIDERFVLGLPLALCVRLILVDGTTESRWVWFKEQALVPFILVGGYSFVRLTLGGSGGSQTVGDYMNQFVFSERLSVVQRLFGAWAGLRIGWILVAAAVLGTWGAGTTEIRLEALLLAAGVALTGLIGLFTALDLSRSMMLIIPAVPLGWIFASRSVWWSKLHAAPVLAVTALFLPASHVVGRFSRPVDNPWSPPLPLMTAQNNLGAMYEKGEGMPKDSTEAARWYRQAAELGHAEAQFNLAVRYAKGEGVPKDSTEAARWYRRAAEQGQTEAQNNLGAMYEKGEGVPEDSTEAVRWYRRAAEQGHGLAQLNLGVMYANGNGVPKDLVQAHVWSSLASTKGQEIAKRNLAIIEKDMTPEQTTEAMKLARELRKKLPKD